MIDPVDKEVDRSSKTNINANTMNNTERMYRYRMNMNRVIPAALPPDDFDAET